MICVSGIPGSGKSTLCDGLAAALGRPVVRFDDHEVLTGWDPSRVADWLDAGAPLAADLAPGFAAAIDAAGPLAILDHPFGRAWPGLGDRIAVSLWIDCPMDIALARKVAALARAGRRDPDFADWIGGWLAAYPAMTRRACHMLIERTRPTVDCSIDGTLPEMDCRQRALSMPSVVSGF